MKKLIQERKSELFSQYIEKINSLPINDQMKLMRNIRRRQKKEPLNNKINNESFKNILNINAAHQTPYEKET